MKINRQIQFKLLGLFILSTLTTILPGCIEDKAHVHKTEAEISLAAFQPEVTDNEQNGINKKESEQKKFVTKYRFNQFPVNKIEYSRAKIKLNTNQSFFSKHYKTRIIQTFEKEPINFAGKYILNYWGCGSPCMVGVAINAKNEKLVELPESVSGYEFQKSSRLLIVNPPDSLGFYETDCAYCAPQLYYLDTIKNKFLKLKE